MTVATTNNVSEKRTANSVLLQKSDLRWREVKKMSARWDLSAAYAEAQSFLELALVENDTLKKLRLMARAQMAFEDLKAQAATLSTLAKFSEDNIAEKLIPPVMENAELEDFSLTGSMKVEIEHKVHCSLKKEKRDEGCDWLEANKYGAIVKRTVTIPFTTKQSKLADKVVKAIEKALGDEVARVSVEDGRNVHPSTLAAWVRERLQEGDAFPTDLFGVHAPKRAKITEKK